LFLPADYGLGYTVVTGAEFFATGGRRKRDMSRKRLLAMTVAPIAVILMVSEACHCMQHQSGRGKRYWKA